VTGPTTEPGGDRLWGAAGWQPDRRAARSASRAARRLEADRRRQTMTARKEVIETERRQRRAEPHLPAGGETGPAALRSYRRLQIAPHRATSEILAGAYPFLAEEGLGSSGVLVGQDAWSGTAFCYDPWELYRAKAITNPNIFLAGQIGRGKSTLAKALAT